jgi:hypothetical protein
MLDTIFLFHNDETSTNPLNIYFFLIMFYPVVNLYVCLYFMIVHLLFINPDYLLWGCKLI